MGKGSNLGKAIRTGLIVYQLAGLVTASDDDLGVMTTPLLVMEVGSLGVEFGVGWLDKATSLFPL
jgi:hypothetical protein